jgi:hypothetical protein
MKSKTVLENKRDDVLGKWFDLIIATYPRESSRILAKRKDQFGNPIGYSIANGIEGIFDQVIADMDSESLLAALDEIIRVRAIQDFKPSQAISFVFQLKSVLREVLSDEEAGSGSADDLAILDARIDQVATLAFDVYMERREKFHEIRTSEIKKSSFRLLERLNERSGTVQQKGEPVDDAG